jgi:tRNA pseudouridine55 synthase
VKIGGERAYRLARRGESVEMPERTVTVHRFEQSWRDGERAGFEIECSSGTYVRSLIAELGDAYCVELRRTRIGPFAVEDAGVGGVGPAIPLGEALARVLPVLAVDADEARRAGHGQRLSGEALGPVLLLEEGDPARPVAVAEPREGGDLAPVVGFRA